MYTLDDIFMCINIVKVRGNNIVNLRTSHDALLCFIDFKLLPLTDYLCRHTHRHGNTIYNPGIAKPVWPDDETYEACNHDGVQQHYAIRHIQCVTDPQRDHGGPRSLCYQQDDINTSIY